MPNYSLAKIGAPFPEPPWIMALWRLDRAGLRLEEVRFQLHRSERATSCPFTPEEWTRKGVGLKAFAVALLHCAAFVEAAAHRSGGKDVVEVAAASSSANWLRALHTFYEEGRKALRQGTKHPATRLLALGEDPTAGALRSGVAAFIGVQRHPRDDDKRKLSLHFGSADCLGPRVTIFIERTGAPDAERDEDRLRELADKIAADTPRWTSPVRPADIATISDRIADSSKPLDWTGELRDEPAWRKMLSLQAQQLYTEAAKLADRELSAPHNARLPLRRGLWAGKAAAAFRAQGRLARAAERGDEAVRHFEQACADGTISALEARFLKNKATFGLVIVRDVMMKANFAAALTEQTKLLVEADELLVMPMVDGLRPLLEEQRYNILRQRHECRRYLGHYEEALASADALERQYLVGSAGQSYCRMHQADNLRLLGRFDESRTILDELLQRTGTLSGDGLQASVLWRRATMRLAESPADARPAIAELRRFTETDERQNRWLSVYGELVLASARIAEPAECERHLSLAQKCGHNSATYRPLEFAYSALIRGELARSQGLHREGENAFFVAWNLFKKMAMPWGQFRAVAGLRLCGYRRQTVGMPLWHSPLDRALMEALTNGEDIPAGTLAWNLP